MKMPRVDRVDLQKIRRMNTSQHGKNEIASDQNMSEKSFNITMLQTSPRKECTIFTLLDQ